ncbi:MAG: hypothetical protein ACLTVY_11830 [Faecalibacterium sp.]
MMAGSSASCTAALVLLAADAAGWLLAGQPMLWLLMPIHITVIASILAAFHTPHGLLIKRTHSGEVRNILLAFGVLAAGTLLALATFYSGYRGRTYAVATAPVCWDFW